MSTPDPTPGTVLAAMNHGRHGAACFSIATESPPGFPGHAWWFEVRAAGHRAVVRWTPGHGVAVSPPLARLSDPRAVTRCPDVATAAAAAVALLTPIVRGDA